MRLGKQGFSLIEIIVVAAILAILIGTMLPFVYKVWESGDIETTKERISNLKKAIIGDPALMQNGVRTHYGFAGDIGRIPDNLQDLIQQPVYVSNNWHGPYLAFGFNPDEYATDAWRNSIAYSPTGAPGELMELRSFGPDRSTDTADDIVTKIYSNEVFPTQNIQGSVHITFNTAPSGTLNYSVKVCAQYRDGTGNLVSPPTCICDSPVSIPGDGSNRFFAVPYNINIGVNIPVGPVYFNGVLFSAPACPDPNYIAGQINPQNLVNVNDKISSIFVNLQIQAVP